MFTNSAIPLVQSVTTQVSVLNAKLTPKLGLMVTVNAVNNSWKFTLTL